jgi:hypothetical protein
MHMLSSARDSASPATQRQRQKTANQKMFFTVALQITAAPHDGPVALSAHGGLDSGKRAPASTTTRRPRRRMDEALHVVSWHGGLAWRTMHSSQMYQQEARALHNLRQAAVQRGYGPSCSGDSFFVAAPATKEAGAQRGCRLPRWSAHSAAKGLSALLGPRGNGSSRRGLADGDAPPPLSTTGPR